MILYFVVTAFEPLTNDMVLSIIDRSRVKQIEKEPNADLDELTELQLEPNVVKN